MSTYTAKCDICGTENTVASYGDWACSQCGQGYTYDECHQIRLTDSQWALLRNPPRWIPVSERLPGFMDTVLAFVSQAGTPIVHCGYYDDGRDAGVGNTATADEIRGWWAYTSCIGSKRLEGGFQPTHWMPLPEPPEVK